MKFFKKKKNVFWGITLVLFLVFVCGNFFTKDAYAITTYFSNSTFIASQIFSGDVVEQEFCLAEGDQGVQVMCGTYLTVMSGGRIQAELYDEFGTKVSETEVSLQGTTDNSTVKIYFGDLDESLYNTTCKLKLTFLDMDDQLLALYASGFYTEEYDFYLNGEEQAANIVMDGIRATTYVEYRDVRMFYVFVIGVFMLYMGMYKITWRKITVQEIKDKVQECWQSNWKSCLRLIVTILGSVLLAGIIEYFAIQKYGYYNPYRMYALFVTVFIIAFANVFKEYVWKKAHVYFFIVTMLVGMVTAFSVPPTPVSWDEQIHYTKTTYMSWGATNRISGSDYLMSSMYTQSNYYNIFEKSQREAWVEEVNEFDSLGGMMGYLQGVQASSVAYVPASMTLYAGRILGLDFVTRYTLGKLTNLFCYALFLAAAVKCMQGRGKLLIAAVGLLPTNMLLASSYGYDWWLTSLIILGYAMFIGEIQKKGRISDVRMMQSVAVMTVGLLAKAVYFPILLPMMLLRKERYEKSKKARWIVVLAAVFLVVSFVLPLLTAGGDVAAGGGDIRGGHDVNAMGQVTYILTNMGDFLSTIFNYMMRYLNPDGAVRYTTIMAYQGKGDYWTVCLIIMGIAAAMDNSDVTVFRKNNRLAQAGGYIGVLGAMILVLTAMYVSYTPVGASTVNGCQERYIIPLLFPFLYFIGENRMTVPTETKRKAFVWINVCMSLIFMLAAYGSFISRY